MVVLRPARLRVTAHGLLAMVEVRGVEEGHRLQRMGMGGLEQEDSWVAEEEVDLEAGGETSEEMGPYLRENGDEANDCQSLDTVGMEAVEEEVEVATDSMLSVPSLSKRHPSTQRFGITA
jgi:hypothetical protein